MREYNGFNHNQRNRAGTYRKAQIARGAIPKFPPFCRACGQTSGAMCYHTEDYSEPHGPHIVAFEICYVCHMMIHCRHRDAGKWRDYVDAVLEGAVFPAIWGWDFKSFAARYLRKGHLPEPYTHIDEPSDLLKQISQGYYNPQVNPAMKGWAPDHLLEAIIGDGWEKYRVGA